MVFASSSLTEPAMITSSPFFQLTGVATRCLAVSCIEFDHAQHFIEIAPGGHRIDQNELDLLVRADDEHVAHRLIVGRRAALRRAGRARRQHAVELGDGEVRVADHRKVRRHALRLPDVVRPFLVEIDRIDAEANDLHAALVEFGLDLCHVAELGGADRGEVLGVRENHPPGIAEPVVKPDAAFGSIGLKVRGDIAELECHHCLRCLMRGEGPAPRLCPEEFP